MANDNFINRLFAISPYIEILARHIYWRNISWLKKYGKKSRKQIPLKAPAPSPDFSKIIDWLQEHGVETAQTIVVHAAYEPLRGTGLQPEEINTELIGLVGERGTTCMPTTPIIGKPKLIVGPDSQKELFKYNVQSNRIKTGALAKALLAHPTAVRSRHPINTLVAVGRRAKYYMENNLSGSSPLPCGVNSSWSKIANDNAWVIGIGTDLTHSLTMIHVAEDRLDEEWPIPNWYQQKLFEVQDGSFREMFLLRERMPKWGAFHFAERTLCRDLIENGILKAVRIDGIIVEILSASKLLTHLQSRNSTGYPYYGLLQNLTSN